jgi:hypothetical protein
MVTKEQIENRIKVLRQQREQAVTAITMIDGALQVLDDLVKEATSQVESGPTTAEPSPASGG